MSINIDVHFQCLYIFPPKMYTLYTLQEKWAALTSLSVMEKQQQYQTQCFYLYKVNKEEKHAMGLTLQSLSILLRTLKVKTFSRHLSYR